jgi:hypothetical protein
VIDATGSHLRHHTHESIKTSRMCAFIYEINYKCTCRHQAGLYVCSHLGTFAACIQSCMQVTKNDCATHSVDCVANVCVHVHARVYTCIYLKYDDECTMALAGGEESIKIAAAKRSWRYCMHIMHIMHTYMSERV